MDMKYSVLMSIYSKEKPDFLKASVDSMIKQSVEPDEIVIVKDGVLTEALEKVLEAYELEYPGKFTLVSLEHNVGLGLALNEGIRKCRNELIARMDTDDISLTNRCELQLNEFKMNTKLSIVGTMTYEFYDNPQNIVSSRVVPTRHEDILKFSRRRSPFNHPTVMYRKSSVLACSGYKDVKRKEDIDLFIRMLCQGYIAANINQPLLLYRSNEGSFARRKSWDNCKSYIAVIYKSWKMRHSKTSDLVIVIMGQIIIFISPIWFMKILSNSFLRKTIKKSSQ